ncbi:MAG: TonB-dependent receptor [Bacteroidia bacterium]
MTRIYIVLFCLIGMNSLLGQKKIDGHIMGLDDAGNETPLAKAQAFWMESKRGTLTDAKGHFSITQYKAEKTLILRMTTYADDTINVSADQTHVHRTLRPSTLDAISIESRQRGVNINRLDPSSTQIINGLELTKAACCNLSETFEGSATVDVAYSDAVTGAKRIKMLGLDGIYTQILNESYPAIRGLVQSYGLTYIPGPFLSGIQVSKGAGSVQNGYESLAGEINVEYLKPQNADPLFVNVYGNNLGRQEANVALKHRFSPFISGMIMAHKSKNPRRIDQNNDGFLDVPLSDQTLIFNRWRWVTNMGLRGQFGVKYLNNTSQSGQVNYLPETDRMAGTRYGVEMDTRRWEAFNKMGYVFKNNTNSSLGSVISFSDHRQDNVFGTNQYQGNQRSFFAKGMFSTSWGKPEHKVTTGLSYRHDDYDESYNDSLFSRRERVPGVFAEYSYNRLDRLVYTAGARLDAHNLYGLIFTPRLHLKYDFTPLLTMRVSAGSGFRVPNPIADYTSLLISGRQLRVAEALEPEKGWNYGFSVIKKVPLGDKRFLSFDLSAYRTHFENQLVIDREQAGLISFSNLDGKSFSEAVQLEANIEVQEGIEFLVAGKYTRARTTFSGVVTDIPFLPRFRALTTMSLATKDRRFQYDVNLQWIGSGRLPNTEDFPEEYQLPERSPSFVQLTSQFTYRIKQPELDLYIGGENLTNFIQTNPILASEEPFNPFFDAAMNYGPILGRRFYAGIRFTLKSN